MRAGLNSFLRLDELGSAVGAPLAVAVGVFDGVHRGHQALLTAARRLADGLGATPAALTFDPHPTALFVPGHVPLLLGTLEERAELLQACGAATVIVARFDRAFAALSPDAFVAEVLLEKLHARAVIVGEDFRYGAGRAGGPDSLRSAGATHGFTVEVVPPVAVDGVEARSTTVRQLLIHGDVAGAARLLGRPYGLWGSVVHGKQLGRTLGFPTANLVSATGVLVPGTGIYAGRVRIGEANGPEYRAAISVGTNPTVTPDGAEVTVEAFLLDGFSGDLYDRRLGVEFMHYLRGMERFDGLDALVAQMRRDVEETERLIPSV